MFKKIISCILAAAVFITAVPMNAFSLERNPIYGDANGDGGVNLLDILTLKKYFVTEKEPEGFRMENADVNVDSVVDLKDLLLLQKYLAEWDVCLGPENTQVAVRPEEEPDSDFATVRFYDGDKLIDALRVEKGSPLGRVPSVAKSSKPDAVLLGYYTGTDFETPFYADNPVTGDTNVYAKYKEMGGIEELNFTSFAQMDMSSDLFFEIRRISGDVAPSFAALLEVKDGSAPVDLDIADSGEDGVYIVRARNGFNEGCSYELSLAQGWIFKDKPDTIRTAAFSIAMKEVENLQMSDEIVYIQDTENIDYIINGETHAVLTNGLLAENSGTFHLDKAADKLENGDLICIYVGTQPDLRSADNGSQLLDPAVYVKVQDVGTDGTVVFAPLGEDDQINLYNIPDNFPLTVAMLPQTDKGTINIAALDAEMYAMMMGEDGTREKALEKIAVGDFITLYTSKEEIRSEADLYYAQITGYDQTSGKITYKKTTLDAINDCMDLYRKIDISGSDLVSEEEKAEIEGILLAQLEESGFAEEAAYLLSDMVTRTDGFRENMSIKEFLLSDADGNPLCDEEIELLNLGGSFELTDDVKLKVQLITDGGSLHFGDGVQLAVEVEAGFEVDVEDGKVAIDLSATFIQEVELKPTVKGKIVTKKILFIPVPIGVEVNAAIDIKNYTAFSFDADIYTVAEKDKSTWEKLQSICKAPTEILGLAGLPDNLKSGLKTVGDVMDKIDELKKKIDEAKETAEKIQGYKEDIEALWGVIEQTGKTDRFEWEQMCETLQKTNVAADLLGLMDMSGEDAEEISAEYLDSMQALIDKYSETVQKETDWVQLVNKEIFNKELNYYALAIGMETSFIVRADVSIAIGSNLEYEVGKRYNFWFRIGLFKPTAGSSTMDLLDERFAFQFYVMGRAGIKAGVRAKIYVGLGTGKFASVGITAELGPYLKLWGFFVYDYSKYRSANTQGWVSKEQMAGAVYLEFGLYFMLGFEANALGNLFEYSYDFLDTEIPILKAGDSRYYYNNAYEPEEDELVIVRDEDGNSSNGVTMPLPKDLIALCYVDLNTGFLGSEAMEYSKYNYTVSNPNFSVNPENGLISVSVPENTRYMECDLTVTYLYGKMAFSSYDMTVTIPIVWTNLSTDELKEFYTASVRVGNDKDGYKTVWRKRVRKNQEYDLPSDEEIKELLDWNDYKYSESTGYDGQNTKGLILIDNTSHDYKVDYKTYSVTVDGIENADGSTRSAVYTAKYGEKFDFSDLYSSGSDIPSVSYRKFAGVTTTATIKVNGEDQIIDLTQNINGKIADALMAGVHATAEYVDDSAKVIFSFTGIKHDDVEQTIRKGSVPSMDEIEAVVSGGYLDILDISPNVGRVSASTVYQVICGELIGPKATIVFNANGGTQTEAITKTEGSILSPLPVPERVGYTFDGWYVDDGSFGQKFEEKRMPAGGAVLYAKWSAQNWTVTFHVNGGDELSEEQQTMSVIYDTAYGALPVPNRDGYAFLGWFTEQEEGALVTAETPVECVENHTLYAHWRKLLVIPSTVFDFGEAEGGVYEKGKSHDVLYTFDAGELSSVAESDFTLKYMRQGNSEYAEGLPVNAGTYDVTVSRPADDIYAKFEYTYIAVITIEKAVRTIESVETEAEDQGYTFLKLKLAGDGGIDDLSSEATFTYFTTVSGKRVSSANRDSYIYDLSPATEYEINVSVTDDPNYYDATSKAGIMVSTLEIPGDSWEDYADESWYNPDEMEFTLTTSEQLAGLAKLMKSGTDFSSKSVHLGADIDLRGHAWIPINVYRYAFNGEGHKITGIYISSRGYQIGVFGTVDSGSVTNCMVDDAYIRGDGRVGGIAGFLTGGSYIDSCVSYAQVIGTGSNLEDDGVGGIAGRTASSSNIFNSVNYGSVRSYGQHAGGIVGYNVNGLICNNANFGTVSGTTCIGGIAGESYKKECRLYNNINIGAVSGTGIYIGAVIGRNHEDDGYVDQCYYLYSSASCNGDNRLSTGTKDGSGDNIKHTKTAYFTSPTSTLSKVCEENANGADLITALNMWSKRCGYPQWTAEGPGGYPVPAGLPSR